MTLLDIAMRLGPTRRAHTGHATHQRLVASVLFAMLACSAAKAYAVGLPAEMIPQQLGVNVHFTKPLPGELDRIHAAGFRIIRMNLDWASTERSARVYDFSQYDSFVKELEAHDLRPMLILAFSNPLYDGGRSPTSPSAQSAFVEWATAAVTRFQGRGVVWELYNEPNISTFWRPKPDVAAYDRLALMLGRVLHEKMPKELLVGPATARIDFKFLEQSFRAGVLSVFSAITVHPYRSGPPETVTVEMAELRALIARYTSTNVPVAIGEWGYSDIWENIGESLQGAMLAREFLVGMAAGARFCIWYDWRDDGVNPKDFEHHYGIVHAKPSATDRFSPKASFRAVQTLTSALNGFAFSQRVATRSSDDWILAFKRGKITGYAVWTVGRSHRVVVPAGTHTVLQCALDGASKLLQVSDGTVAVAANAFPKFVIEQR